MDALREEIGQRIQRYAELLRAEEGDDARLMVSAWAVAYEYEAVDLVEANMAGRSVIVRDNQTISASSGLGRFLQLSFDPIES